MKLKQVIGFSMAVGISLLAAIYTFGDSAHSIGLITKRGGKVRHPSVLTPGKDRYVLISTATVIPPYRGSTRVVLEGEPQMEHEIYFPGPLIDFGVRRLPKFKDNIIHDLQPLDRLAVWVVMYPPIVDPVCGMAREDGFIEFAYEGKEYYFCAEGCLETFKKDPVKYENQDRGKGEYHLAFHDTKTGKPVLRVPLVFGTEGGGDECEHH